MDVDDVYFQQDGATCHKSNKTIGLLRKNLFQANKFWFLYKNGKMYQVYK